MMSSASLVLTWFMLILLSVPGNLAKYEEGHLLSSRSTFEFLARFCWLSDMGALHYYFEYPKEFEVQTIGLYYDSPQQWPLVYNSRLNCSSKMSVLQEDDFQLIYLRKTYRHSGCAEVNRTDIYGNYKTYVKCSGSRGFSSARERWWFIAVMNCESDKGLDLKYKLTMTNGHRNEFFFRHFSADEFYILQTDISALFVYLSISVSAVLAARQLKCRQLYHVTYKIFLMSVFLRLFSLLFLCIAYGTYARNGVGLPTSKSLGIFLAACSTVLFQLLLVLIAKGFTVTRGRLRQATMIKIAIFFSTYTVVYISLFIYNSKFMDPGEVLYIYESPAGYGVITMRLIGWLWFVYAITFTLKHYPEKSLFYLSFFASYSFWFVSTPLMIIIATFRMEKWVREKVVNGVEISIDFTGHLLFFILTLPFMINKFFPYHVRTTQVAIAYEGDGRKDNTDNYPHNVYETPISFLTETVRAPQHEAPEPHHIFTVHHHRAPASPSAPPAHVDNNNLQVFDSQDGASSPRSSQLEHDAVILHTLSTPRINYYK